MKSFETIAHEAYDTFLAAITDGAARLAAWSDLPRETKDAWIAATRKMAEEIQQVH
ncbi:hypothetical protein [Comamonas fluminis]|uniref:hypothetical protein n=1 Tax=Comamonas fluminis TaxID=2796366 RepID=UPI001C48E76E|nr:hypothetical protein [Comamonas fluminis]